VGERRLRGEGEKRVSFRSWLVSLFSPLFF
jgi:hypothetical protein